MTIPIRSPRVSQVPPPYFVQFENRLPPAFPAMSVWRQQIWQVLAGVTIGLGLWYLLWRWTQTLNPDAVIFSVIVSLAETVAFVGTLLFFFDIWSEGDTPMRQAPSSRSAAHLDDDGPIRVDIFITTYNEEVDTLLPSIFAAQAVEIPEGVEVFVHLLDDGNRKEMAEIALLHCVNYIKRSDNRGFKAGNLGNALLHTSGDFIVICDADTRLFSTFLRNTLGYFHDAKVAWVQTPHWFYDIPEGNDWGTWLSSTFGNKFQLLARPLKWISGHDQAGSDPFMSDPALFFDVIQRRRNRNGASFCCGAASIHRREPLFEAALRRQSQDVAKLVRKIGLSERASAVLLNVAKLQPFRFHVSEDILTSIVIHSDQTGGWSSVYHPDPESRMLSPWSMDAWATQKLKYAGGTFDIILRDNPILKRGLPWRKRLHYTATFWSYLSALWVPILLLAPVVSLFTGIAPIEASTTAFFLHLLPLLLVNELAVIVGCNGHNPNLGRMISVSSLSVQWIALWKVICGKRPSFPVTPKTPGMRTDLRQVRSNLFCLGIMGAAAAWGVLSVALGSSHHQPALVVVNLFWLSLNCLAQLRLIIAALWKPPLAASIYKPIERIVLTRVERASQASISSQKPNQHDINLGAHDNEKFNPVAQSV